MHMIAHCSGWLKRTSDGISRTEVQDDFGIMFATLHILQRSETTRSSS
ncbi:MAG: hypothetical protein RBR05_00775 [Candidatus Methanomethylophilaceae archaeon]|nr:hypothetical protein [Candidatus Methanomethylophilaceae archaeon]